MQKLNRKQFICNSKELSQKSNLVHEKNSNSLTVFSGNLSILDNRFGEYLFQTYLTGEDQSSLFMVNKTIKESFSDQYKFNLKIARAIQFVFKDPKHLTPHKMVEIFKSPEIHESLKLVYSHVNNRLNFIKQDNIKLEPSLKNELIDSLKKVGAITLISRHPLHMSLYNAVKENNEAEIIRLLSQGADIYMGNDCTFSIFRHTFHDSSHFPLLVRKLIGFGFDVNHSSSKSYTPLIQAILENDSAQEIIPVLLDAGARVNFRFDEENPYSTPLQMACKGGNLDVVRLLLNRGAHTHVKNKNGNSILHYAISSAEIPVIQTILDIVGLEGMKEKDDYGETGLHIAIRHGFNKELLRSSTSGKSLVVQFLIDNGAEIEAVDNLGQTALHLAAKLMNFVLIKLLVHAGADINARDKNGNTPLLLLITSYFQFDDISMVKFLVEINKNVSIKNNEGNTLLHLATRSPQGSIFISYLLSLGANVFDKNKNDETPLHFAAGKVKLYHTNALRNEDDSIMKLLIAANSDVHVRNIYGETPLCFAVKQDNLNFVKLLIENGAELNTSNINGDTPMHLAARLTKQYTSGHMLKYLLEMAPSLLQVRNIYGETPYQIALRYHEEAANEMKPYVTEEHVGSKIHPGLNPFHRAIRENNFEMEEAILNRPGFVDEKDCFGKNAIWHAACVGNIVLIEHLLDKGVELDSTAFHAASSFGHKHVIQFFIDKGIDIQVQDFMGKSALHYAIHHRQYEMAVFLIEKGIDVLHEDKCSQDAFYCKKSDLEVMQIFESYWVKKWAERHEFEIME